MIITMIIVLVALDVALKAIFIGSAFDFGLWLKHKTKYTTWYFNKNRTTFSLFDSCPFKLSNEQLNTMTESFDSTAGWLVKDSELKYWIEKFVNENRT